jgi:hypothetical protein
MNGRSLIGGRALAHVLNEASFNEGVLKVWSGSVADVEDGVL